MAAVVSVCACSAAPPPVRTVSVARPPPEPPSLRAPQMRCAPPRAPEVAAGWRVVQWPRAPRFVSVEAQAGALYATTTSAVCASEDGGGRWHSLIEDVEYPTVVSTRDGRVTVRTGIDPDGNAVPGAEVAWWISEDGGERWRRQTAAPEAAPSGATPSGATVRVHASSSRTTVSCGGVQFTTVSREGRGAAVIQSLDGGDTWQRVRSLGERRVDDAQVRCAASGVVLLERGDRVPIALSRDAGATWRSLRAPPVVREDDAEVGPGCEPFGERGVLCELYGQTFITEDDGRHWRFGHSPVGGRSLPTRGARIVAVGGGVATSDDGGRRWSLVAPAPGGTNLGLRGGVVSDASYWLAGTALWWTDDGGARWQASLLPWQLVSVVDRRRWVGFDAGNNGTRCGGTMRLTINGGRTWTVPLPYPVATVRVERGTIRATTCGRVPRTWVSRNGARWSRAPQVDTTDADDGAREVVETDDGVIIEVRDGSLVARRRGETETLARRWPEELVPVAARSRDGAVDAVLFGNGTVLRRDLTAER